jgi:hypothetical protein
VQRLLIPLVLLVTLPILAGALLLMARGVLALARALGPQVRDYVAGLVGGLVRGWDAFFFTPADPTPLGLIRVATGLLLLWSVGVLGLDLRAFLGSGGWVDPAVHRQVMAEQTPWAWSFWFWVPDGWLVAAWVACLLTLLLFTVGLFSRVTAVLSWVIVVATARRAPVTLFGFDQIISTWALYLAATGASGQAVSLDRFLARWRRARAEVARRRRDGAPLDGAVPPGTPAPTVSANLGLRLIQLHLALIYGTAGLAKLQGPAWWEGTVFAMLLGNAEFRPFDMSWLAAYPYLLNLATHASLVIELTYPVLVWDRRLRPLWLALAGSLHVGIAVQMGLYEFALAMIAGNLAFASGPWLRGLVAGPRPPSARVLYDGACPRCRASMAWPARPTPTGSSSGIDLNAVDPAAVHPSLTRSACLRAMHLVRADGRVDRGYDAVLTLARGSPGLAGGGRRPRAGRGLAGPAGLQSPGGLSAARRPLHRRGLRTPPRGRRGEARRCPVRGPDRESAPDEHRSEPRAPGLRPAPLFLREPGWRIAQKTGSEREFCYMTAPGQDYYHRLLDGELFAFHGIEKLCLACADRRGLLSREPRPLREAGPHPRDPRRRRRRVGLPPGARRPPRAVLLRGSVPRIRRERPPATMPRRRAAPRPGRGAARAERGRPPRRLPRPGRPRRAGGPHAARIPS